MPGVPQKQTRVLTRDQFDDIAVDVRKAARIAARQTVFDEDGEAVQLEALATLDVDRVLMSELGIPFDDLYVVQSEFLRWEFIESYAEVRKEASTR